MARLVEKLTPLAVSKQTKPGYFGDGAGLWLQVSPSGSKSWIFRFTLAGKQREMGLGAVHTVNLTEARAKAKECRQVLLDGKDPLDARRSIKQAEAMERAKAMAFDQCAEAYIVPGERMKMGKEHRVPLSKPVISLLKKLPREGDLVFPAPRKTPRCRT